MLYLTLDIGNTSCRAAVFRNGRMAAHAAVPPGDPAELKRFLGRWKEPLHAAIISSVAVREQRVEKWLRTVTRTLRLSAALSLPVRIGYRTPRTLGSDRLACAAGARCLFPGRPLLVIDAGTCVKYDFVSAHGGFYGGAIAPGLQMRLDALHRYTAALPQVSATPTAALTGRDTRGSILSGVINGIVFEADGFIRAYRARHPDLATVITGGDGPRLASRLKSGIFARPQLIHTGLYEILLQNLA